MTPTTLKDTVSCLRSTNGYVDNKAGVWTLVVGNVPRVSDRGLLVEEARTNFIRNNSMQGAVAGTPGTLPTNWGLGTPTGTTRTIVGKGTENGIDYIDIRVNGTTTNANNVHLQFDSYIAAVTAEKIAISAFVKLVAGSWANVSAIQFTLNEFTSGPVFVTQTIKTIAAPTDTLSRRVGLHTTVGGATTASVSPYLSFVMASGVAVDFTVRIGWPQLEKGPFATSPIRTTTTAQTRAADIIRLINPESIINPAEQTILFEMTPFLYPTNPPVQIGWAVVTFANCCYAFADNTEGGEQAFSANSESATQIVLGIGVQQISRYKTAFAIGPDNARGALNGALGPLDTDVDMPIGTATSVAIGSAPWQWSNFASGYYHKVWFMPTRETDGFLQHFTRQYVNFNPDDKAAGIVLLNSNVTVRNSLTEVVQAVRSTTSHNNGKYYFEVREEGRVDVADIGIGLATGAANLAVRLGSGNGLYWSGAYYDNGNTVQNSGAPVAIPETLTLMEWLGFAVDFAAGKAWIRTSVGWHGSPTVGNSPVLTFTPGLSLFVAMSVDTQGDQATVNFGARTFTYEIPDGYMAWDMASRETVRVTFNPDDAAADIRLSNDSLTISTVAYESAKTALSTLSHTTGKRYFEMKMDAEGVSDSLLGTDGIALGLATWLVPLNDWLGKDIGSIGIFQTGKVYHDYIVTGEPGAVDTGRTFEVGDWVGIAVDFNAGKMWFRNATGWYGSPVFGGSPAATFAANTTFFAAASLWTTGDIVTANFGRSTFAYDVPDGYGAWEHN